MIGIVVNNQPPAEIAASDVPKGRPDPQSNELMEMTNREIMDVTGAHKFLYFIHFKSIPQNSYELIDGVLYKKQPPSILPPHGGRR